MYSTVYITMDFTVYCLLRTSLFYTIRYYTMLYFSTLQRTILFYNMLHYTTLYYTFPMLYYTTLYYAVLYYTILCHTILYYSILSTILYKYTPHCSLLYYIIQCHAIPHGIRDDTKLYQMHSSGADDTNVALPPTAIQQMVEATCTSCTEIVMREDQKRGMQPGQVLLSSHKEAGIRGAAVARCMFCILPVLVESLVARWSVLSCRPRGLRWSVPR